MSPVPLSEKQEEKMISNLNPSVQEDYELLQHLIDDGEIFDENGVLISEVLKKEIIENLFEELGMETVYDNVFLYRRLNLVIFNDLAFELLEATKSGSIIKFRDSNGKEFHIIEKEYPKFKEKLKKKSQLKPPKSKLGQDALRKLSGGGG